MAVSDPSTNYGWEIPDVGGDVGSWGGILRTLFSDDGAGVDPLGVDGVIKAVSDVADAALPKAGGTLTGPVLHKGARYTAVNLGSSLSGTVNIDLSAGDYFYGTVTGNVTFNVTNPPASGQAVFFMLEVVNAGAFTITWPSAMQWTGGTAPSLTSSGTDILTFVTRDNGTTIHGAMGIQASS